MGTCVLSIFVKRGKGGEEGPALAGLSHRLLVPRGSRACSRGWGRWDGAWGCSADPLPGAVVVQGCERPPAHSPHCACPVLCSSQHSDEQHRVRTLSLHRPFSSFTPSLLFTILPIPVFVSVPMATALNCLHRIVMSGNSLMFLWMT